MALRDKMRANAQPFLEPGETVQAVFGAQTGPNPYLSILTYLVLFWVRLHLVVVTDRRILVIMSSYWKPSAARSVEAVLPRGTQLGPLSGLWAKRELNGTTYWIHKRFHKDAAAADALLAGGGQLPAPIAAAPPQPPQAATPAAAPPQPPPVAAPPVPQPVAAQPAAAEASFPADWYPDPHGQARLRYWDGTAWTGHTTN
jgi:hypothetical protein